MSQIVSVTQDTFSSVVLESDKPVLVDFWASWCQPCLRLMPTIEEIAEEYAGRVVVAKVNVDDERTIASLWQVMSIPTLMFFSGGKKVDELVGGQAKKTITATLETLL